VEAIHAGQWEAEKALPSERLLSEKLGVSRVTARKALDVLVEQRLINRRQGSGTFILPRLEQPLTRLTSFTELVKTTGVEPSTVWLERKISLPSNDEVLKLAITPTTPVARLQRLRLADGTVMAIETSALPAAYLPNPLSVGHSLYAFLEGVGHR